MKIPKYVYELVELGRLRPAPLDEQANSSIAGQGEYGYMFRWNGVAAYKDQFNKNFREKVSK